MNRDELFKIVKEQHPDWPDEQIWTQVSVMIGADDAVSRTNPDTTPIDQIIEIAIEKAEIWLRENLPLIFAKVADFFARLWDRLPDIVVRGFNYIWRVIEDIFN